MAANNNASVAVTNGVRSHSQTLNHVVSYPLIADVLQTFESTSVGSRSISLVQSLQHTFVDPVLPYLQTPISIAEPYLAKVDSLGDSTLKTVDDHFPAVRSTHLSDLQTRIRSALGYPFKLAGSGLDYVHETYVDEYKKTSSSVDGNEGVVTTAKAIVSTELRMASDAMHYVADILGPRKEKLDRELGQLKKTAEQKLGELQSKGEKNGAELKKKGEAKAQQAEAKAQQVNNNVQQQVKN